MIDYYLNDLNLALTTIRSDLCLIAHSCWSNYHIDPISEIRWIYFNELHPICFQTITAFTVIPIEIYPVPKCLSLARAHEAKYPLTQTSMKEFYANLCFRFAVQTKYLSHPGKQYPTPMHWEDRPLISGLGLFQCYLRIQSSNSFNTVPIQICSTVVAIFNIG